MPTSLSAPKSARRMPGQPRTGVVQVAVIGCGQWGKNLIRNFSSLGALQAMADPAPLARAWAAREYPGVALSASVDALLEDPEVQACVIATPAALHYALARRALEAGKDVLVEKPLALTVAEGQALVALAQQRGRILMVGHLLEYHPAVGKLRELIAGGTMGKVCYIYSHRLNLGRIRTEENALWSFAPHDIHIMLRLLGEGPVEVACRGGSYLTHHIADVTMSEMRFASGVRSHIFVSWLHPYKEHRLVVVGDRQMAVFDDTHPTEKLRLYPHRVDWIERAPVAVKAEAQVIALDPAEPLRVECEHFLRCVAAREVPRTDGHNGVEVLQVLEACQQSLEQGGVPISVAVGSEHAAGRPVYQAHPTATIDAGAAIGENTSIGPYTHVMTGARIGQRCVLGPHVLVPAGAVLGNGVQIQHNVSFCEGLVVEDGVSCGASAVFISSANFRSTDRRQAATQDTRVHAGAVIGANATILRGCVIGRWAVVEAGAVVMEDVPDFARVVGHPARLAGWICQCGGSLPVTILGGQAQCVCTACGATYKREGAGLRQAAAGTPRSLAC